MAKNAKYEKYSCLILKLNVFRFKRKENTDGKEIHLWMFSNSAALVTRLQYWKQNLATADCEVGLGWKETTLDKFWSGERESVKKSYFHSCPSLFSPSCLNSWNQSLYWNLKLIVVKVLGWIDNDRTNFSLNYWHHENMLAFVKTNRSNPDDYSSIAATKNNSHNPSHANCQSVTLSQHIFVISLLIFYKTQFQKNSFFEETNFSQTTKQFKPRFAAAGWIRILLILYATIVSRWFSYYEA